ncbi:MAG: methionine synthase I, cobalamin-binding domain-containing protein, partial [Candidatus Latescibacteria bacterium]|nr:methionine synthase I, cobalamin-binding domain-containing protein [bacterium]MBD3425534.1 methionine synthase I, cobalamin-binding domain-containing protein [Candidatus Latescibacterota bacterium]
MERFRQAMEQGVLIFDGGMGSMLIAAGLTRTEVPESWVIHRPEEVMAVHTGYIKAGADVIQTATFGASSVKLASSSAGAGLDPYRINLEAAGLVRDAIEKSGSGCLAAGDIGPTGEFFPPVGTLDEKSAMESFREQAGALAEGGVDILLIETMSDLKEAVVALRAAKEAAELPVVVELTFQEKKRGYFTIMGDTPERAAEVLMSEGADMAGANCTLDSAGMVGLAGRMVKASELPLLFQPNAGQPVMRDGTPEYLQEPEDFASDIEEIVML